MAVWQVEGKLFVCTWMGKLRVRIRLGKGELTSCRNGSWCLQRVQSEFMQRVKEDYKDVKKRGERDISSKSELSSAVSQTESSSRCENNV